MSTLFSQVIVNEMGAPEISPLALREKVDDVEMIDVRRDDEFVGELGHISGAKLVTLGGPLESFLESAPKDKTYVFICRSGGRSSQATIAAKQLGFQNVFNMEGGMLKWNALDLPVSKDAS